MQRLLRRLAALEALYRTREEGVLHLWRVPTESVEEACARHDVDPGDFPAVRVHLWSGERASSRLVTPPAPCWIPQTLPVINDLERELLEGLRQWRLKSSEENHNAN
jgi:hypothetical protein